MNFAGPVVVIDPKAESLMICGRMIVKIKPEHEKRAI